MPSLTGVWRLLSGTTSARSSSISRSAAQARHAAHPEHASNLGILTLGAIGVVYGDIGTSPLYAMRESVHAATGGGQTPLEPVI